MAAERTPAIEQPVERSEAVAAHQRSHTRHPSTKEYVRIAVILGVITAAEVAIYYVDWIHEHGLLIPLLFLFAVVKFSLVVMWFMHLRFDSRTYARFFVMGLAGAITLFLVVLLIYRTFSR